MDEIINPWKPKPIPTARQVEQIVSEALTDWVQHASLPYTLRTARGEPFELRQQELFRIQQIVKTVLSDNVEYIDEQLKQHLGNPP